MKSFIKVFTIACLMLFMVQCEVIDPDLLDSPNSPSPENVDPDLMLNSIQLSFAGTSEIRTGETLDNNGVYQAAAFRGAELTRMRYLFGSTYGNAYTSQDFNAPYQRAYSDVLIDVKNLLPIAEERELFFHMGVAKTLQAYTLLTVVDMFGDMPFSEALDSGNFNPRLDNGEDIYNAAIALLDEAVEHFQDEGRRALPAIDMFYGALSATQREEAWIRAANTIKLKAYLNTGNASGINALISENRLIDVPAYDFAFRFGTSDTNPDARHPNFVNSYQNLPAGGNYMSVSYLNMLLNDKSIRDPRLRYYVYRQNTTGPTTTEQNQCIGTFPPSHFQDNDPWCELPDGYWGRDHLIDDGIPADTPLRTTFGVYPVGGRFDANQSQSAEPDHGFRGAGIHPVLMSSFTHFMLAEAAAELGANANALDHLLTGVEQSLETVRAFGAPQAAATTFAMTDAQIADYLGIVTDRYTSQGALRTIAKEYYLALWPNGIESYNLMRRTGYPNREDNLQPARTPNPGNWYRTFSYPANMIERNVNISAKPDRLVSTFWDPRAGSDEFDF